MENKIKIINDNFNEKEYLNLCKRFDIEPVYEEIDLRIDNKSYFERMKDLVSNDRRGEVVFCVVRPNGKIIAVTCEDYPEDIYRIPTGGLGYEEDIIGAVNREVKEELGLDVKIIKFGGVIKIKFIHENESFMFYSYLFILKEVSGRLLLDALEDEISEIREVALDELEIVVEKLNNIKNRWKDWGKFRYTTSKAIVEILKEM